MVSIVIPAYNAEKYIERCVKSVLTQSCTSYELIIVDDGSTDQTIKICKSLCESYKNCFILRQKNSGVSAARNQGILYAKGDWIVFLDSDDYLEKNFVEKAEQYSDKKEVDFLLFNFTTIGRERVTQSNHEYVYTDSQLLIDGLMKRTKNAFSNTSLNSPWAKAYRRELICNARLRFEAEVSMGEDMLFNLAYYKLISKYIYFDQSMYNYQFSSESLARKFDRNLIKVDRIFHEKMCNILEKNGLAERYFRQIDSYVLDGYLSCIKRSLFHPSNLQEYSIKVCQAKELTMSMPYCRVLHNNALIREHCKVKDKLLIYLSKYNQWRLIGFLIRVVQITK